MKVQTSLLPQRKVVRQYCITSKTDGARDLVLSPLPPGQTMLFSEKPTLIVASSEHDSIKLKGESEEFHDEKRLKLLREREWVYL